MPYTVIANYDSTSVVKFFLSPCASPFVTGQEALVARSGKRVTSFEMSPDLPSGQTGQIQVSRPFFRNAMISLWAVIQAQSAVVGFLVAPCRPGQVLV
jgi:hypothetical protein